MPRDLMSSRLLVAAPLDGDDADPLASMGNLMDVMLVFACGLLLALVANWNVDLAAGGASRPDAVQQVDGAFEEVQEGIDAESGQYTEVGAVYRDEETGVLYLVP